MRILVRPPAPEDVGSWHRLGWRAAPDLAGLQREHEAFRAALANAGADVLACPAVTRWLAGNRLTKQRLEAAGVAVDFGAPRSS